MLVGHNPAFTYCVELLSSETIDNLPTCGLVRIDFDTKKWSNLQAGKGKLKLFEYPKKLGVSSH